MEPSGRNQSQLVANAADLQAFPVAERAEAWTSWPRGRTMVARDAKPASGCFVRDQRLRTETGLARRADTCMR